MHPILMAAISAGEIIIILSLLLRFHAGTKVLGQTVGGQTNRIIRSLAAE